MPVRRLAVFFAAVTAVSAVLPLAATAPATAATAKPVTPKVVRVAGLSSYFDGYTFGHNRPAAYVTPNGSVHAAWLNYTESGQQVMVGRKAKSAGTFTTRKLYTLPDASVPYVGRLGGGTALVTLVVDGNTQALDAWRSTDDGVSWARMDLGALNGQLSSAGLVPEGASVVDVDGATYAQVYVTATSTSEIVELPASLDSYQVVAPLAANGSVSITAGAGTVFSILNVTSGSIPFTAGTHSGTVSFPCGGGLAGTAQVAGTRSGAVAVVTGCGKVYARSISPDGRLGKLVTVAAAPGGKLTDGYANGHVSLASVGGTAYAVFSDPSGDLRVASTRNGTSWKVGTGLVPMVAGGGSDDGGPIPALSGGAASWVLAEAPTGMDRGALFAAATSATYAPPAYPSGRGLGKSAHARLGSLAATVPVAVSHTLFVAGRNDGVGVRVRSALADRVTVSVTVETVGSNGVEILYGATATRKVSAGKVVTIIARNYPDAKVGRHARVVIDVSGRTGTLAFSGKTT